MGGVYVTMGAGTRACTRMHAYAYAHLYRRTYSTCLHACI